jgi:hypothetical protein
MCKKALSAAPLSIAMFEPSGLSPQAIGLEEWSKLIGEYLAATATMHRHSADDFQRFWQWLERHPANAPGLSRIELSIIEQSELRQRLALARFRQLAVDTAKLLPALTFESPYTLVIHPESVVSGSASVGGRLQRAGIVPVCYSDGADARVLYVGPRTAELLRECRQAGPLPLSRLMAQVSDDERRLQLDRVRRLAGAGILALAT